MMDMDMLEASKSKLGDAAPPQCYQPQDNHGSTRFPVIYHPQTDKVCEEVDKLFLENWPWRNDREREIFPTADYNKWTCMCLPFVKNDRMLDIVKVNTWFILIDGTSILQVMPKLP